MTIAQAKANLRQRGVVLTKRDGEFRVNVRGGREATAYYTNDITDAVLTGGVMAEQHDMQSRLRGSAEYGQ